VALAEQAVLAAPILCAQLKHSAASVVLVCSAGIHAACTQCLPFDFCMSPAEHMMHTLCAHVEVLNILRVMDADVGTHTVQHAHLSDAMQAAAVCLPREHQQAAWHEQQGR
jgi:hypothetical protein